MTLSYYKHIWAPPNRCPTNKGAMLRQGMFHYKDQMLSGCYVLKNAHVMDLSILEFFVRILGNLD